MKHGKYIGPNPDHQGETALIQDHPSIPQMYVVQFDRFIHPHAHGWHGYSKLDWELDPEDENTPSSRPPNQVFEANGHPISTMPEWLRAIVTAAIPRDTILVGVSCEHNKYRVSYREPNSTDVITLTLGYNGEVI